MKQIENRVTIELEINKSKFITNLVPVETLEQTLEELSSLRKKYYNATHNCYAYILDEQMIQKMSDDGEPSRTAGYPILNALLNYNLNNVLCVVTRYFGGVKLGKGGLIRAYKNATVEAIKKASFYQVAEKQIYLTTLNYSLYDSFSHYLKGKAFIIDEQFTENVTVKFYLLNLKIKELSKHFQGQITFSKLNKTKVKIPL